MFMDDTGPMLFTNMSTSTTVGLTAGGGKKKRRKLLKETFLLLRLLTGFYSKPREEK